MPQRHSPVTKTETPAPNTPDHGAQSTDGFPAIEKLVPHAQPMLLIDRILAADDTSLKAEVGIDENSLFYDTENGVPAYVGIEYIAQAVSAYSGWRAWEASKTGKSEPRIGYLLGTRKMTLHDAFFKAGDHLTIDVENIFEDGEMGVFDGTVCQNGQIIVSARINVYQPKAEQTPQS